MLVMRASDVRRHRAFANHQLKAKVDDRLLRATALDRIDHHGDGVAAHFIAIGAHAGERGDRRGGEFQVVEPDNRQIAGNRYLLALAFEQVPSARSSLTQNTASMSGACARRSANRVLPRVTEVGTVVVTIRRGSNSDASFMASRYPSSRAVPVIDPRPEQPDSPATLFDQMRNRRDSGVVMREADHHVDRVGPDLHDLRTGQFMDFITARDSAVWLMPVTIKPAGLLCLEQAEQPFLLQDTVASIDETECRSGFLPRHRRCRATHR